MFVSQLGPQTLDSREHSVGTKCVHLQEYDTGDNLHTPAYTTPFKERIQVLEVFVDELFDLR